MFAVSHQHQDHSITANRPQGRMEEQLRDAAYKGNLPTVRRILQQPPGGGFNVNAADEEGMTALHYAARFSVVGIVRAILQVEGVNVNVRACDGSTPLHMAFIANQLPIIRALLEAGADPNTADNDGETPLFWAARDNSIRVLEALLDRGATPAVQNRDLVTPLHIACSRGRLDIVELLIRRQGSECLTFKNNRERTPLDRLLNSQNCSEVKASIGQHILQSYAGMLVQRYGLLCLHSVLQDAAFIDSDNEKFQLPVGKLNTEYLQILLEYVIAAEPGSVRTLDRDDLMPLQVASQLNYPDLVLNVLLRPYPGALLLL